MNLKTNKKITILHINDAVTPGGSLVVMDSLIKSTPKENISNKAIIANKLEILDIKLENNCYDILRPKYSYPEHTQLIGQLKRRNKFYRILQLIIFESKRKLFNSIYTLKLFVLITKYKPDLVHIHSTTLPCLACILARTPYIFHLHGAIDSDYSSANISMINKAHTIIAISDFVAQSAGQFGLDNEKISIIANPIRLFPHPKHIDNNYRCKSNDILIGHFGRIVRWKGQLEFVEAFNLAKQKIPDISAIIVGEVTDGNDAYLKQLTKKTRDLGIEDSVKFVGYKQNTQDYYNICDIIIHSSIEPEPFGLVIIEAMAAGKPVIASTLGAAPEIVDDGISGLIADPRSSDDLSAQIIKLAESEELRKQLGSYAKIAANQNYNLEFIAKKFCAVYKEISNK